MLQICLENSGNFKAENCKPPVFQWKISVLKTRMLSSLLTFVNQKNLHI